MPKLNTIRLLRVRYIPKTPEPGVLYVSEEFGAAVHLCACGCGTKVSTPLGPTEWSVAESASGPSLTPSVGNWQIPCKSHYWIRDGGIVWAGAWCQEQISAGREAEQERRRQLYDVCRAPRPGVAVRLWRWFIGLFK